MRIDKHINKTNWEEIEDILSDITEIESLDLSYMGLTEFPKMSHITIIEWFNCSYNQISSFKDCPIIGGSLDCSFNQITSFKDCPKINGNFWCNNNQLKSFKDCPIIGGSFNCSFNQITSFKDCPVINDSFYCSDNKITSFKGCPRIKGNFDCYNNKITSFKDCPEIGSELLSDFRIFDNVHKYSKERKISLLESQVELYNKQDDEILAHIDKFPDLVAYHRMKELNKLLCT